MTVAEAQEVFVPALAVWREMRGESDLARCACFWVIRNRSTDNAHRWPRSLYEVVTQRNQFSSFNQGDPNASLMPRSDHAADWQAWQQIQGIIDNPGTDPVEGANMYEAEPDGVPRPAWTQEAELIKQIGKTRFYKL